MAASPRSKLLASVEAFDAESSFVLRQRRQTSSALSMSLAPGTLLGRYRVREKIGAGGMGEVYLAQDTGQLERAVAVKVLSAEVASDPRRMRRFVQEARTVSGLTHPNILTVYDFGEEGEARFVVTEYVEGLTLRRYAAGRRLRLHEV